MLRFYPQNQAISGLFSSRIRQNLRVRILFL